MAREIHIHRADGMVDGDQVEAVTIRIEQQQESPDYGSADYAARVGEMFKADGKSLAAAIWEACPGGTISELIAELLERRSCHFRVRFPQEADR